MVWGLFWDLGGYGEARPEVTSKAMIGSAITSPPFEPHGVPEMLRVIQNMGVAESEDPTIGGLPADRPVRLGLLPRRSPELPVEHGFTAVEMGIPIAEDPTIGGYQPIVLAVGVTAIPIIGWLRRTAPVER